MCDQLKILRPLGKLNPEKLNNRGIRIGKLKTNRSSDLSEGAAALQLTVPISILPTKSENFYEHNSLHPYVLET